MSIWAPLLTGARLLDLFAGSGAVGLEALGRGAATAVFVEDDPGTVAVLRRNIATLEVGEECLVIRGPLPGAAADLNGAFDLVFADPPYGFSEYDELVEAVIPLLSRFGELVVEHGRYGAWEPEIPAGFTPLETRRYGDSLLTRFLAV